MATYAERRRKYLDLIAGQVDLVFIPFSTDLDYLAGIRRDTPNFGRVIHPGGWLEGAWMAPGQTPILTLPRMTAELGGRAGGNDDLDVRVLGEWDDPRTMVRGILDALKLPAAPRVAVSETAEAETMIELQQLLPDAKFSSATALLRPLRQIKDADEIALMRAAGAVTEGALKAAIPSFKAGMTELEMTAELDLQMKRLGSLGPSFTTTLYCTGPEHPWLPGDRLGSWPRPLLPGVSILLDFGAIGDGPVYDYGRTVVFGAPSDEQLKVHGLIMQSQAAGIAMLKAGEATCAEADAAARAVIADAGYGEAFRHRLGHSIGWDVHEPPFLTKGSDITVEEGMVFTVEPSILQMHGTSARVEDCVVVRPGGGEALTSGFQELIVID